MNCSECGQFLDNDSKFCIQCGAKQLQNEISITVDEKKSKRNTYSEDASPNDEERLAAEEIKKNNLFHSIDEYFVDALGSSFIYSVLTSKALDKSILICSNRRIYQKGKLYNLSSYGKLTTSYGIKSVDIPEVTGVGYEVESKTSKLVLSLFLIVFGLVLAGIPGGDRELLVLGQVLSVSSILGGLFTLIIYFLKKGKWFYIEYAGGRICASCSWYSDKSINRFMKQISLQKDKLCNQH